MTRPMAALAVVAFLAACATASEEPTLPPRPSVPEHWRTITSERDLIDLVVPPDMNIAHVSDLISGSRITDEVADPFLLMATSPLSLAQPTGGESAFEWVERSGALTGHQVDVTIGQVERRELLLPAGPALELTTAYRAGSSDFWTIVTVIDTGSGYALLEFGGHGRPPAEPIEDIGIIQELVLFRGG